MITVMYICRLMLVNTTFALFINGRLLNLTLHKNYFVVNILRILPYDRDLLFHIVKAKLVILKNIHFTVITYIYKMNF